MKANILTGALVVLVLSSMMGCGSHAEDEISPSNVVAGLRTFKSCGDLSDFLTTRQGTGAMPLAGDVDTADAVSEAAPASVPAVMAVEEADLVKREGDRLYIANVSSGLLIYDVSTPADMHQIGRLDIPGLQPLEMQISGDTILLIENASSENKTKVAAIDAADPTSLSVLKTWEFPGSYQESRQVGSAIYLVLNKRISDGETDIKTQLEEKNPCDQVYVPEDLEKDGSGAFNSWNLIGLSLTDLKREPMQVSVIGSFKSVVYATPEHFYLANYVFGEDQTGIYLLELSPATAGITPVAKAMVPGSIVNQFSMDEDDGVFRIASTGGFDDPKNYLTTFQVKSNALTQLGQIDTIVPGETITATRFLGKRAFVTTAIEWTDPLVSIDLTDPTTPEIKATIDLPGRPDYIHVWNNLLMTVGGGGGWDMGVTLNLFDITSADKPVLVEQKTVPEAFYSEARADHRAFAFFEDRAILAIPVSIGMNSKIVLYRVQKSGLTALGEILHDDLYEGTDAEVYSPTLRRALEIDDSIVTVSDVGIKANDLEDFSDETFGEIYPGFELPVSGCGGCYNWGCVCCAAPPL